MDCHDNIPAMGYCAKRSSSQPKRQLYRPSASEAGASRRADDDAATLQIVADRIDLARHADPAGLACAEF